MTISNALMRHLLGAVRDLTPVFLVIGIFQVFVIKEPFPDLVGILTGVLFIVFGLTLFIEGLQTSLFPIGESLAYAFAKKGSLFWLLLFSFGLGFGTTMAEPTLTAVAIEAAEVAAKSGYIGADPQSMANYAGGLRLAVGISVGFALTLGVLRILRGWPLHYLIMGGYLGVVIMTYFAPAEIVGIAYDSGGVTTSTITVPLVTALGVGLASSIKGRNPLVDGFGLIAFASLTPMIFVMAYGVWVL